MRRLLAAAFVVLAGCAKPEAPAEPEVDTRGPISVEYVRGAELKIHAKPDEASPVITKYMASESVSVLSRQGEWAEVRTASGSGWAKASELATGTEMLPSAGTPDNLAPRFIVPPEPVSQPGARGEIVLEADVSAAGEVFGVRILTNTTNSDGLAARNVASLQKARFAPIIKHGQRMPFTYEHRVHY